MSIKDYFKKWFGNKTFLNPHLGRKYAEEKGYDIVTPTLDYDRYMRAINADSMISIEEAEHKWGECWDDSFYDYFNDSVIE